ncbi:hypothetical protein Tco_0508083 [Tanacetum coccineum]
MMFFKGIDQSMPFTMTSKHKGVVYLNQHNVKSLMRISELKKFCVGTLEKIQENLIDMVTKNKLGKGNKRLKGRDWTEDDVVKKMVKKIDQTLNHKEQLRRLEEYVGGRPKTVNPHTFVDTGTTKKSTCCALVLTKPIQGVLREDEQKKLKSRYDQVSTEVSDILSVSGVLSLEAVIDCDEHRLKLEEEAECLIGQDCERRKIAELFRHRSKETRYTVGQKIMWCLVLMDGKTLLCLHQLLMEVLQLAGNEPKRTLMPGDDVKKEKKAVDNGRQSIARV